MDEVVTNVEVGLAVAIEIPEHDGQTPVTRGINQGLSLLVEEEPHIPRGNDHVGSASVNVQRVGLPAFEDLQVAIHGGDSEVTILRFNHRTAIRHAALDEPTSLGRVMEGVGTVMGDIHVEVSIAIDVGQGHRRSPGIAEEPHLNLREMALSVVMEGSRTTTEAVDQQVEVSVSVEVGEVATGGILIRTSNARTGRDIFKTPVTKVAVENVVAFKATEIDIHTAVAIDVAQGDARAQFQQTVPGDGGFSQMVSKTEAGRRCGLKSETRTGPGTRLDRGSSESDLGLPLQSWTRLAMGTTQHQADHEGHESTKHAHTMQMAEAVHE